MTFSEKMRKRAKHEANCRCMICNGGGEWGEVDVHSIDRSHQPGTAMVLCRRQRGGNCHQIIHTLAGTPEEVRRLSVAAASFGNLALAVEMIDGGVPVNLIRKKLNQRPF